LSVSDLLMQQVLQLYLIATGDSKSVHRVELCLSKQFDYEDSKLPVTAVEAGSEQLLYYKRLSRHMSDTSFELVSRLCIPL